MPGCTSAPASPAPQIIYVGCPKVSACRIPASRPATNGDLSADIRQLEDALAACAVQVDTFKTCQEQHDVKAATAPR
ncbi:Rz1-like lysis system protein LysC [Serratia entomophila]|uniref:Rz1-like lysis system protein LysC n=1 Tax=Serratia entomophila TaxID=42906 RepID=UPI0021BB0351|nr:Rz1-like lysis system protein LysC [Serratia entomophila]